MDGTRDCHTESSESEREKQILYINAYMWNLEGWYRWSYLQSRNRDADKQNTFMDPRGERGSGRQREVEMDTCTLLTLCTRQMAEDAPRAQGTRMPRGDLNGREVQKGVDVCVRMADPFCSTVETNTTL